MQHVYPLVATLIVCLNYVAVALYRSPCCEITRYSLIQRMQHIYAVLILIIHHALYYSVF